MFLQMSYYKKNRHHSSWGIIYILGKKQASKTEGHPLESRRVLGCTLQSSPQPLLTWAGILLPGSLRAPTYLHSMSPNPLPSSPLPSCDSSPSFLLPVAYYNTTHQILGSQRDFKRCALGSGGMLESLHLANMHIINKYINFTSSKEN